MFFTSDGPGNCHVSLTFAGGFTSTSDVTFTSNAQAGSDCPPVLVPSQTILRVNNPASTCSPVDAGGG